MLTNDLELTRFTTITL